MPPAGTLTGIAKRNLKGVELFALNTPDQTGEAMEFIARHGAQPASSTPITANPTWRLVVSPDRKSTRLNSSHANISYAVFCLTKNNPAMTPPTCDAASSSLLPPSDSSGTPPSSPLPLVRVRPNLTATELEPIVRANSLRQLAT